MASKAKLLSTAAIIAANVKAQSEVTSDFDNKVGSLLLEGIGELMARVADKDDATTVDVGADYVFALKNAELARKGKPALKSVDKLDGFARTAAVKVMRVAAEREWWPKYLANLARLHRESAVRQTNLMEFARRIFGGKFNGKKSAPVNDLPSVDTLRKWRDDANKGRKAASKRKPAEMKPADRISGANDLMTGYETWLPTEAHAHGATIVRELATIASMIKADKKPNGKADERDAIIKELQAKMAALMAA